MRILMVSHFFPMPDRQADLRRLYQIVSILCEKHEVFYFAQLAGFQYTHWGKETVLKYESQLETLGVSIVRAILPGLRAKRYDAVLFEYYQFAQPFLDQVRCWCPQARIVIDSVDLAFRRQLSRAEATKSATEAADAATKKKVELSVYSRADVVVAI
jgi:hypothetical protein